jgi:MoaA/NifB/PqqE/SkfB family radical SAM enzyme
MTWEGFAHIINKAVGQNLVEDILLLGGEPLYFDGIIELIQALNKAPIITTNMHRLVAEKDFLYELSRLRIKALNISLPHYDENKRAKVMGRFLFTNMELATALSELSLPVYVNTLLIKGCIDNIAEIERMAEFCSENGAIGLKVRELTAINRNIHDFVSPEIIEFNRNHYIPIPVKSLYAQCHKNGGTFFWKNIHNIPVVFNAPPDRAMKGGRDITGKHYHRVLFNDGFWGYSWRRHDGLFQISEVEKGHNQGTSPERPAE